MHKLRKGQKQEKQSPFSRMGDVHTSRHVPFNDLPPDVFYNIGDYDGTNNLNRTSSIAWNTLGHRHAHYVPRPDNIERMMEAISNETIEGPESFKILRFDKTIQERLFQFCTGTAIKRLKIIFHPDHWHPTPGEPRYSETLGHYIATEYDVLAEAVLALNAAPNLDTLELDFSHGCNRIGGVGADVLSDLKHAENIRVLRLNLLGNNLNREGALYLSELKHSQTLRTLYISVRCNHLLGLDYNKIAELKTIRTLQTLCIDIGMNGRRRQDDAWEQIKGVERLVDLSHRDRWGIHTLAVNFSCNHIASMDCFRVLQNANYLRRLELNLSTNNVGDNGVFVLVAALKQTKVLDTLYLDLTWNLISDVGAVHLTVLTHAPALSHLHLVLTSNEIEDPGAIALSNMKNAQSQLRTLYVNLDGNNITDRRALSALNGLPIQTLIDFTNEGVRLKGFTHAQ
jgi:hypothetical protein